MKIEVDDTLLKKLSEIDNINNHRPKQNTTEIITEILWRHVNSEGRRLRLMENWFHEDEIYERENL